MDNKFGVPNKLYNSNRISRLKYGIASVPIVTIYQYFRNRENFYFLLLAIFQLLTLGPLPREYSPTGAYSTAIPLALCIFIEIIIAITTWIRTYIHDNNENHKSFSCYDINKKIKNKNLSEIVFEKKFNKDIYPGHIIYLEKDDICPVDGIFLSGTNNDEYAKVNMALLTGESNITYVAKASKNFGLNEYIGSKIVIDEYYPNQLLKLNGKIITSNEEITITGKNLIVAGSIIRSLGVYIWTIACGKAKKNKVHINKYKKYSRIDQFVGKYMINTSAYLLLSMVLGISLFKMYWFGYFNPLVFLIYLLQNWILFNGIIPFSVKILLIIARNIESFMASRPHYSANETLQIDDLTKIRKIICDKTGTITKNKLEFVKMMSANKNDIIDITEFKYEYDLIGLEFLKCLSLCIHYNENDYATVEDRIIRTGYEAMKCSYLQNSGIIQLIIDQKNYNYEYIDIQGLDFSYDRKMSSKLVKNDDNKYYIYSKGSLDVIYQRIRDADKNEFRRIEKIISDAYPDLRLLAFGYNEIAKNKIAAASDEKIYSPMESDLIFLGIIGIRDIIHTDVDKTIEYFDKRNITTNLCTGDRRITAIEVSKQIGIIRSNDTVLDFNSVENPDDCRNCVLTLGSITAFINDENKMILLEKCLLNCGKFVAYGMTPNDKKEITKIYENQNIPVLTIGDGFNDLGMFSESAISVAIRVNSTVENSADFTVNHFVDLEKLFDYSTQCYHKNAELINFTFYRCSMVIFTLLSFAVINIFNNNENYMSPLDGFVIQGFNFAWTFIGSFYYIISKNKVDLQDFKDAAVISKTSYRETTVWNILGIINGILIILYFHYYNIFSLKNFNDLLALVIILMISVKTCNAGKNNIIGGIFSATGIFNYFIYMIYRDSFWQFCELVNIVPFTFWLLITIYGYFSNSILRYIIKFSRTI